MNGEFLRICAMQGQGLVGIATSKKIGCHADRNRVKRRVSEAIRLKWSEIDACYDYVVIVSPSAKTAEFSRIQNEVQPLFSRAVSRWIVESQSS